MSIDAAIGRIDQILAMQQQLLDPAAASSPTTPSSAPAPASAPPTGTPTPNFAATLAQAQAGTPPATATGYVNPLANAQVTPERIDQGVDYAGTGSLGAIGPGVVTQVV